MAKIQGKNGIRQTTTIIKNNFVFKEPQDIANVLADTFAENSSDRNYRSSFLDFKKQNEAQGFMVQNTNDQPINTPFTILELNHVIDKLPDNKSPGPDQIPYEFIKHFSITTRTHLLQIYNYIWTNDVFPDNWREVIIIPILKPMKDQTQPTNYRPIALSNNLCKVMEKLVNNRLMWYLESKNLISNMQCAFRANRSTTDLHFILQSEIQNAFRNKQHLVAVFFDLEKAFDTTYRLNILRTLKQDSIEGHMLHFINNFLTNRRFKVRTHGCISDTKIQENGIPQGASLSTTLFLKALDSIITQVQFPTKPLLFADDLVIFCKGKDINTIRNHLQSTLHKIEKWTETSGFKFSPIKTKAVHFSKLRKQHTEPRLKLYNINIPIDKKIKFLGLIFDSKLTWKYHVKELQTECHKRLNILKSLSSHTWGAHTHTLLTIYKMLIRSKIDYGSIVYTTALPRTLKPLDVIQNTALRLATGAFRTSPVKSMQNLVNETPLSYRRTDLTLKYIVKIACNPQHPCFSHIYRVTSNNRYQIKNANPQQLNIYNIFHNLNYSITKPIQGHSISSIPPWLISTPQYDLRISHYNKEATTKQQYLKKFHEMKTKNKEYIQVYTDASKHDTQVGAAVIFETETNHDIHKYRLPETTTIFNAEVYALYKSLQLIAAKNETNQHYIIYTDSLPALKTIRNLYPKETKIQQIQEIISRLDKNNNNKVVLAWVPSHVGIRGNEAADLAAKQAATNTINNGEPSQTTDELQELKRRMRQKLEEEWRTDNSRLRQIKDNTKPWIDQGNRRQQIIINRLRLGHTRLTHCYLFKKTPPDKCDTCDTTLTIQHLIIDCPQYTDQRRKHKIPTNLKDALQNDHDHTRRIMEFLKDINQAKNI